jgi:hypothetical protein
MNKAKALRIGKAGGVLLWAITKFLVVALFWVLGFLIIGGIKLLLSIVFAGTNTNQSAKDESEWWWYQNHGDPGHLYDKKDDK